MNRVISARRLLLASGVALSIGLPLLACSGSTTDGATDAVEPEPAGPETKIVGSWRMVPDEATLRLLKVVDAAISGKPNKKEKLGTLTADEEALFAEWSNKKGSDEAKLMKSQLRFIKDSQFTFTDKQVTVKMGDETVGPIAYEMVSATDANTTLKFDIGNGKDTHSFDWTSATKGVDNITSESGEKYFPLNVSKR